MTNLLKAIEKSKRENNDYMLNLLNTIKSNVEKHDCMTQKEVLIVLDFLHN